MGTSLTGLTPSTTYDALIKVGDNEPLSATAKYIGDGLGNDSKLALSTTQVGIGSTSLSAWSFDALQVEGASLWSSGNDLGLNSNSYYDGTNYVYRASSAAARLYFDTDGSAFFANAAAGTAGNPITFNERFKITASGNVGIGTASPEARLDARLTTNTNSIQKITRFAANNASGELKAFDVSYTGSANLMTIGTAAVGTDPSISVNVGNSEIARFTTDGLTFNGDTAAANALDDYEEGTFTPTLTGSGSNPTYTATSVGIYTKIGRQVTAQVDINISAFSGGSGATRVELPFTVANSMGYFQAPCYVYGVNLSGLYLTAEPNAGNSFMQIIEIQDDAAATALDLSSISAGDIIRITATYFV